MIGAATTPKTKPKRRNFFGRPRGIAAHHDNAGLGIAFVQLPDRLPALGVPFVGDGAGVDEAEIRRLRIPRVAIADLHQALPHQLRLVLVDFAAERGRAENWHGGITRRPRSWRSSSPCSRG